MLQITIKQIVSFFDQKNRWWFPLISGLLFSLCYPPFNADSHWLLFPFPFLSFGILLPLLGLSLQKPFKRAVFHCYLYSFALSIGQYYWLIFDKVEGLWHLIILGLLLGSAVMALIFLGAALLFRLIYRNFPKLYIVLFPAVWVLIDYIRTLGDLGFPWSFLGYALTPVLPLSQLASVTGVWGLTYLTLLGNMLLWELISSCHKNRLTVRKWLYAGAFVLFLIAVSIWGIIRMNKTPVTSAVKVSVLQGNLDQFNWGNSSLDTAFAVLGSQMQEVSKEKPDLVVSSESSILSFVARRSDHSQMLRDIVNSAGVPLVFGSLHWDNGPAGSPYEYLVYNTAFLAQPGQKEFQFYHKIKLVPFSEAIPFEVQFPILSRVNLGEADFQRGKEHTIFNVGSTIKAAPLICYEAIFPEFVQQFAKKGANLLVMITNDGWFGKSTGPYHHAEMARMRAIECGIPIARSANSGISMFVDAYGRIGARTGLYERTMITQEIYPVNLETIYTKWGAWLVKLCFLIASCSLVWVIFRKFQIRYTKS